MHTTRPFVVPPAPRKREVRENVPDALAFGVLAQIGREADAFAATSPIVRGPAELSHALLRIVESREFAQFLAGGARTSSMFVRSGIAEFISTALMLHAHDRGLTYRESAGAQIIAGQVELWAAELARGGDRRRTRVLIQLALSEELNAHLVRS